MAIELTTILQHANAVNSDQSDQAQIYINAQGDISNTSGLDFFKRLFSSSARADENRATLQAFHDAIAQSPAYMAHLENEQVANFFKLKHIQATPLTAKDVQLVNKMMNTEQADGVAKGLVALSILPEQDRDTFTWFCTDKNLHPESPEDMKNALKEFAMHGMTGNIRQQLSAANLPREKLDAVIGAAMEALKASSAWSAAQDSAFEGDLNSLTLEGITRDFTQGLQPAVDLMLSLIQNCDLTSDFLQKMTNSQGPGGITLFNGTLEAVVSGAIAKSDAHFFFNFCSEKNVNMGSPELLISTINDYFVTHWAQYAFALSPAARSLPNEAYQGLIISDEYTAHAHDALEKNFQGSRIPTRDQIMEALDQTPASFLEEKKDSIQRLLRLAKAGNSFDPALRPMIGTIDQNTIDRMISPLLSGELLLDHLLDPDKGPDLNLINLMDNFMAAVSSYRNFFSTEVGDEPELNIATKALALLMGARGATGDELKTLLEQVNKKFSVLAPSLQSLNSGVSDGSIAGSNNIYAGQAINRMQSIMGMVSNMAYSATTEQQRRELGISAEQADFYSSLEYGSQGELLPASDIHQSARAFGARLGLSISQQGYQENVALAENVAQDLTGPRENPVVTDELSTLVGQIAREINFDQFNEADLDPGLLGTMIREAVSAKAGYELLTPDEAKAAAAQAIRDNLLTLKGAMDYIQNLPTQADPDSGQEFTVTEAEKESLLRVIPGTTLRDPAQIRACLLQSRTFIPTFNDMANKGQDTYSTAFNFMTIGSSHCPRGDELNNQAPDKREDYDYRPASMLLALDALQLDNDQAKRLFDMVAGSDGMTMGGNFIALRDLYQSNGVPAGGLQSSLEAMDELRQILGRRLGSPTPPGLSYYATNMSPRSVPHSVTMAAIDTLRFNAPSLATYQAMTAISPQLTNEEWDILFPILEPISKGLNEGYGPNSDLRIFTAHAQELLAFVRSNRGKAPSAKQIWQIVIGGNPPKNLTMNNLGKEATKIASWSFMNALFSIHPKIDDSRLVPGLMPTGLRNGIPYKTSMQACLPGGHIGLEDLRLGTPPINSPTSCTPDNAFGMTEYWHLRGADPNRNPSMMTIKHVYRDNLTFEHHPLSPQENVKDNRIFSDIIERCGSICRTKQQAQRVMQVMSNEGADCLNSVLETFTTFRLSNQSHINSTVTPQENWDVVVELANSEADRPFGLYIQFTVRANGEAVISDLNIDMRG